MVCRRRQILLLLEYEVWCASKVVTLQNVEKRKRARRRKKKSLNAFDATRICLASNNNQSDFVKVAQ